MQPLPKFNSNQNYKPFNCLSLNKTSINKLLLTIFVMIDSSTICQLLNKAHHSVPESKVTSPNCFICPARSTKPTTYIIQNKEKQEILTFKKLEPESV